jgi:hypothetical protein
MAGALLAQRRLSGARRFFTRDAPHLYPALPREIENEDVTRTLVHIVQVVAVVAAMLVWLALIPIVELFRPRADHGASLEGILFQAA